MVTLKAPCKRWRQLVIKNVGASGLKGSYHGYKPKTLPHGKRPGDDLAERTCGRSVPLPYPCWWNQPPPRKTSVQIQNYSTHDCAPKGLNLQDNAMRTSRTKLRVVWNTLCAATPTKTMDDVKIAYYIWQSREAQNRSSVCALTNSPALNLCR